MHIVVELNYYSNSQQLYSANSSRTAVVLRSYIRKLRPRGEWLNGVGGCVVGGAEWVCVSSVSRISRRSLGKIRSAKISNVRKKFCLMIFVYQGRDYKSHTSRNSLFNQRSIFVPVKPAFKTFRRGRTLPFLQRSSLGRTCQM